MTSDPGDKPIRLSMHARGYLGRRGFTELEVVETIRSSTWLPASKELLEASRDFPYDGEWNGRHYATKQVRPIFIEEEDEIVVVTVFSYFF